MASAPQGRSDSSPAPTKAVASAGRRVLSFADGWRRRAQSVRRRRSHRLALAIGAVAGVLLVAWVVLASPLLAVSEVQASGSTEAVRSIAERVGGEQKGRSLLLVDTAAVEEEIESDSRVADATVRRGMPRSLVIEVVARVPVLALEKTKGQVELLDMTGVRIQTVKAAPAGVPVVKGGSGVGDEASVRAALHVLTVLPESLRAKVRNLRFDQTGSISFELSGTTIVWGSDERAELKARLVQILLTKKPKSIIVSAPDTPVTT